MRLQKMILARFIAAAFSAWCLSAFPAAYPDPPASPFATQGATEPVETVYQFSLNGQAHPALMPLLRNTNGDLLMSAEQLREIGLIELPPSLLVHDGMPYIRLKDLAGATLSINSSQQSLLLQVDPSVLNTTIASLALSSDRGKGQGATGAFLNYNLLASGTASTHAVLTGLFEVGVLAENGMGLSTFTYAPLASADENSRKLLRLDTSWRRDDPQKMASLVVGDSYQRVNLLGRSVRFGGVSYSTNFQLQPNLITSPLQAVSGLATLPSTAEIYINQKLSGTRSLPPGPFSITNIPLISGLGEVSVVVRDALGREQVLSQPFYSSQSLLAPGMRDYAVDVGFARQNYGQVNAAYGPLTSSIFYRQGMTRELTGEARLYHLGRDVAGGAVATWAAGAGAIHGLANVRLAGSRTANGATNRLTGGEPAGAGGWQTGVGFTRAYEYRLKNAVNFLLDATFSSPAYRAPGTSSTEPHPMREFFASAGRQVGSGSLSLNLFERRYRDAPKTRVSSLSYSRAIAGNGALTLSLSKSLSGSHADTTLYVSAFIPIGFGHSRARVTLDAVRSADGSVTTSAMLQSDTPQSPGMGYRARVRSDRQLDASITLRRTGAIYTGEVGRSISGETGWRAGIQGGVGFVGGHWFAAPPIDSSFAIIKVDDYANVKVFRENNLVGTTGADGYSVVTSLLPYGDNLLSIDPNDLPIGAKIGSIKMRVSPYYRGAVVATFPVKRVQSAVFRLVDENGADIPAGTIVKGGIEPATVGADGEVFLQELPQKNMIPRRYSLEYTTRNCYFHLPPISGKDVIADIGIIPCRSTK